MTKMWSVPVRWLLNARRRLVGDQSGPPSKNPPFAVRSVAPVPSAFIVKTW
jgi:hypothetical protein